MRILALATSHPLNDGDGTAPFIREITRGLAARGHAVRLLLPEHPDLVVGPISSYGLEIQTYRYLAPTKPRFGYGSSLMADRDLRFAAILAAITAVPSLAVHLRQSLREFRPDVVHAHWVVPNAAVVPWLAAGVPVVFSEHGSGGHLMNRHRRTLGAIASRALLRSAAVTACSAPLADAITVSDGPRPKVIPYGFDRPRIDSSTRTDRRRELGLSEDDLVVVAVGRLVEKKGFEYLIRAAERLATPMRLLIVGDGDLRTSLSSLASELGVAVRFVGQLDRETTYATYLAADIAVVPSIVDRSGNVDGLPNVLLESMSFGLPVIASDVAGIPSVISSGETGILVPEKDVAALAASLEALASDVELRRRLGERAARHIDQSFSWASCVASYEQVLAESC